MEKTDIVISGNSITKTYGGITALHNVDFEFKKGEVHALMGENGAGKSTLAKIIAGIEQPDNGEIFCEGKLVKFTNPKEAINLGISIVLQEFNLIPDLSVAENIFLNHKKLYKKNILINKSKMVEKTEELLDLFSMKGQVNPLSKVRSLSIAEMQIIEIIKSVAENAKVIFLDEPTAALSITEVKRLFEVIKRLKEQGVAFVIVSHRFEEIFAISDRITVLRDGHLVLTNRATKTIAQNELIKSMVGREISDLYGSRRSTISDEVVLEIKNLTDSKKYVRDVSFKVKKGEVVGLSGLVGAGRSELVRSIFGVDGRSNGEVFVKGKELKRKSSKSSIYNGLILVPEDRKNDGLILGMSILKNMTLSKLGKSRKVTIHKSNEIIDTEKMIRKLKIKIGNFDNPVKSLSGGNQQKVLLAKWLLLEPDILIVDEPTRGIDISAKSEIYSIINDLVSQGVSIVIVSSELQEILGMCDRVLVMRDGKLVKELNRSEASEEIIMQYASLGSKEDGNES